MKSDFFQKFQSLVHCLFFDSQAMAGSLDEMNFPLPLPFLVNFSGMLYIHDLIPGSM